MLSIHVRCWQRDLSQTGVGEASSSRHRKRSAYSLYTVLLCHICCDRQKDLLRHAKMKTTEDHQGAKTARPRGSQASIGAASSSAQRHSGTSAVGKCADDSSKVGAAHDNNAACRRAEVKEKRHHTAVASRLSRPRSLVAAAAAIFNAKDHVGQDGALAAMTTATDRRLWRNTAEEKRTPRKPLEPESRRKSMRIRPFRKNATGRGHVNIVYEQVLGYPVALLLADRQWMSRSMPSIADRRHMHRQILLHKRPCRTKGLHRQIDQARSSLPLMISKLPESVSGANHRMQS